MGSCRDLLNKPDEISCRNIQFYRYKLTNGLFNPKLLSQGNFKLKDSLSKKQTIESIHKFKSDLKGEEEVQEHKPQIQLHKELLWPYTSHSRVLFTTTDMIDFRFVESGRLSAPFSVSIVNTSNERVRLKWCNGRSTVSEGDECAFIVSPEEAFVEKRGQVEFKVCFKPNRSEAYFFSNLTCMGQLMTDYKRQLKLEKMARAGDKSGSPLRNSDQEMSRADYVDPPIVTKVSCVGHSFPPSSQIFIPISEIQPSNTVCFPPASVKQSQYKTFTLKNKADTPLFFRFNTILSDSFTVYPKIGLIKPKSAQVVLIEFCPKEVSKFEVPLLVTLNHDPKNMKKLILQGVCVDPEIEIDQGSRMYLPPSFVGLTQRQKINIKNLSPIKININSQIEDLKKAKISLEPSFFDLEGNQEKECDLFFTPFRVAEVKTNINLLVSRTYESHLENIGIFNPGSVNSRRLELPDSRTSEKSIEILGRGSDGKLTISPLSLDFGTVKVGFHRQLQFTINNPTICTFYVKLKWSSPLDNIDDILQLDFKEGLINSLCTKLVSINFKPTLRFDSAIDLEIFAEEKLAMKDTTCFDENKDTYGIEKLKARLSIKAKGDYPLLKIVDIRNSMQGTAKLWHSFNVEEANEELLAQLTREEQLFVNGDNKAKNIKEYYDKLKCIKFDFGSHIMSKSSVSHQKSNTVDIYVTLKNIGGVLSEFYFKFSDDVAIHREVWMDPVEQTSNETLEYKVLKEKIFEIEPRKNKLKPGECCNIRFRYTLKESSDATHKLRVIFQIVNGKPLIFELQGQTHTEKKALLEITNPVLDFNLVPMGYVAV